MSTAVQEQEAPTETLVGRKTPTITLIEEAVLEDTPANSESADIRYLLTGIDPPPRFFFELQIAASFWGPEVLEAKGLFCTSPGWRLYGRDVPAKLRRPGYDVRIKAKDDLWREGWIAA